MKGFMMRRIFEYSKAIAALLGSVLTAVLGVLPPDEYRWLAVVAVAVTAVATYAIPNSIPEDPGGRHAAE